MLIDQCDILETRSILPSLSLPCIGEIARRATSCVLDWTLSYSLNLLSPLWSHHIWNVPVPPYLLTSHTPPKVCNDLSHTVNFNTLILLQPSPPPTHTHSPSLTHSLEYPLTHTYTHTLKSDDDMDHDEDSDEENENENDGNSDVTDPEGKKEENPEDGQVASSILSKVRTYVRLDL